MKVARAERSKYIAIGIIAGLSFILFCALITFLININENMGLIPLIFIILAIYSFTNFVYYMFYQNITDPFSKKEINVKPQYLIFFFVNLFLFVLSYIVLWR